MRTINDLDADEQHTFINSLRDRGIDVNTADEYEIFDEKEALSAIEDILMDIMDRIRDEHGIQFVPRLSDVMYHYEIDEFFTEVGVGMFIYN